MGIYIRFFFIILGWMFLATYLATDDDVFFILTMVFFVTPLLVDISLILRRRMYVRNLKKAILQVEGNQVVLPYQTQELLEGELFHNALLPMPLPNLLVVHTAKERQETQLDILQLQEKAPRKVKATLELEGKQFVLSAYVLPTRCSCDHPVPCWTANHYIGEVDQLIDDWYWQGVVSAFVFDDKKKKKSRHKKRLKLPSWKLFPDFRPAPM